MRGLVSWIIGAAKPRARTKVGNAPATDTAPQRKFAARALKSLLAGGEHGWIGHIRVLMRSL
jgi:hypothetical protein